MENERNNANDSEHNAIQESGTIPSSIHEERSRENQETDAEPGALKSNNGITPADIEKAVDSLNLEDNPRLAILLSAIASSQSAQWSGILPDPQSFNQYPEYVQKRMLDQADAFTTDESKRQNKLVDAEVKAASENPKISAFLFVLCLLAGFVAFLITSSQWSWTPLALPAISFLRDLVTHPKSQSSKKEEDKNNKDKK